MSETILAYVARRPATPKPCRICRNLFNPKRKRQVLCGKAACTAENHRRHGEAQWNRTGGTNFHSRSPNKRFKRCPCGAKILNTCGNKKYCDRCRAQTTREKKALRAARRKATGVIDPKGSTSCPACGSLLHFSYDFLGRSLEQCAQCGERPVTIYGKRSYDQRVRLEAELRARQDTVEAPIDAGARERSRGRTQYCKDLKWGSAAGDAYRQDTHKRGSKGLAGLAR